MPAIKPINITGACPTRLPLVKSGATSRRRIGPAAWRWRFKAFALVIGLHLFWWANAGAAVNVLTWHNDNFRSGQNTNETVLTPANVNTNTFGLLFSYPVDGQVYGQPLYVSGLQIPGLGTRNVVFITTQHDSVYAFDADGTNGLIWHVSLGTSATTPNNDFGNRYGPYHDIDPEVGITSTPVIDLASGTIYVDAFTHEGGSYFHRIHALNIINGVEKPFSPVLVTASVPGIGVDSVGGVMTFNPTQELQRVALTLAGGKLYVGYAGYADTDPYHGWVISFNATNLVQLTNYVFNTTPNSTVASYGANAGEGGIWMSGSGLAVDAQTNLFIVIGNGSFNPNTVGITEYGDSAVRLATTNGLSAVDYFTPYNQATLAANDTDFGSGGPLLLPDSVGSIAHPHLMVACGKEGTIYLLDRDNLGHFNASGDTQIVQSLPTIIGGTWSSAAYFNQRVYYAGSGDALKNFTLSGGLLSTSPATQSANSFAWPGATPAISANGTNQAIAWALDVSGAESGGSAVLHAYNAYNLSSELYNSSQAGIRDQPNVAVKFTIPTVANGKVYVGAGQQLAVYGNGSFLALPAFSPAGGYFTNSVSVTITDATPGATIYYTLDNSTPGTNSPVYAGPLTLTNTALVQVKAFKSGYVPRPVVSALFINAASANFAAGFARQEFYPGALRTDLENPAYTGQPSFVNYLSAFETPSGQGVNYAERVSGYFIPPVTTNYVFFVCSDDDSDLFLSTDSTAVNKHLIAQETAWSNSREWTTSAGGSVLASKRSDQFTGTTWPGGNTIHLLAGVRYYLEGDHHQAGGGDDFAATYKFATAPDPADGTAPVLTGANIGVVAFNNTYIFVTAPPQSAVAIQNSTAAFGVSAVSGYLGSTAAGPAIICQWQSAPAGSLTFTNIPGANSFAYTTPLLTPAQNGALFRATLTTAGFVTNTPFATLTVIPDTHTPVPVAVISVSTNARSVVVQFSEALDSVSAQTAANYVFTPGNLAATSAALDASGSNVTLTVGSPLPQGINLTLSVTGVKNIFGNAVLPGTAISFSFVLSGTLNYPATVLADGPLACWRLNETSGTVANDATGAFNGTYASGATPGVAGPRPPAFAGFEITNTGAEFYYNTANSFVTVPALNLRTNTVTFLAWLYPIGSQANYSGLLMTRAGSTQAGLGYTTANQIGYTWNGNTTWTFQSSLVPPQNQWSLVAMVISPAQAVLYLLTTNGVQSATNAIAHQKEIWDGTAQIGNDAGGGSGSRTFNGVMDEVAVFNKSLSFSALTNLYQAGIQGGSSITNNPVLATDLRFTSITAAAGQLILQWSGSGTLEEATNLFGPWTASTNQGVLQSAPDAGSKFYRLQH
jgi:hypothetical protein